MSDTATAEAPLVVATFRPRVQRYDLKSVKSGWVELQRLAYGARLQRLQLASTLKTSIKPGGRTEEEDIPAEIASALVATTRLDFAYCVVDSNLGNQVGRKLDFHDPKDVEALDPAVGEEISELIDKHNGPLTEEEQGN